MVIHLKQYNKKEIKVLYVCPIHKNSLFELSKKEKEKEVKVLYTAYTESLNVWGYKHQYKKKFLGKNIYLSVTCHVSPTATASATATDPPPANSPTIHSRLVCQNKKKN